MPLANELRTGCMFLHEFRVAMNYGPLSLNGIQVRKIIVVDHLGVNIPVPEIFCSTQRVAVPSLHYTFIVSSVHDRISITLSKAIAKIVQEVVL
jgi:hypothetical protein